jgi:hypothetical protein
MDQRMSHDIGLIPTKVRKLSQNIIWYLGMLRAFIVFPLCKKIDNLDYKLALGVYPSRKTGAGDRRGL